MFLGSWDKVHEMSMAVKKIEDLLEENWRKPLSEYMRVVCRKALALIRFLGEPGPSLDKGRRWYEDDAVLIRMYTPGLPTVYIDVVVKLLAESHKDRYREVYTDGTEYYSGCGAFFGPWITYIEEVYAEQVEKQHLCANFQAEWRKEDGVRKMHCLICGKEWDLPTNKEAFIFSDRGSYMTSAVKEEDALAFFRLP